MTVILGVTVVPRFCPKNSLEASKRSTNNGKLRQNVFKNSKNAFISIAKTLMTMGGIETDLKVFEKRIDTKKMVSGKD